MTSSKKLATPTGVHPNLSEATFFYSPRACSLVSKTYVCYTFMVSPHLSHLYIFSENMSPSRIPVQVPNSVHTCAQSSLKLRKRIERTDIFNEVKSCKVLSISLELNNPFLTFEEHIHRSSFMLC